MWTLHPLGFVVWVSRRTSFFPGMYRAVSVQWFCYLCSRSRRRWGVEESWLLSKFRLAHFGSDGVLLPLSPGIGRLYRPEVRPVPWVSIIFPSFTTPCCIWILTPWLWCSDSGSKFVLRILVGNIKLKFFFNAIAVRKVLVLFFRALQFQ